MKLDKIIYGITIICMLSLVICNVMMYMQVFKMNEEKSYFERRFNNISKDISGVNIPGCGYFVSTYNKNWTEVSDTDVHEQCHELIVEDYEHYCR